MENLPELCDAEYRQAWDDATLDADHWAALSDITPINAAMLLCRLNPNEQSYDDAKLITTDETKPEHLVRLVQRLTDLAVTAPKPRTLRNWHQTAIAMGLTYHSWIDGYMDATTGNAQQDDTATPAPVVQATETKEQRQDRRLKACIDDGLPMDTRAALLRLPDGVGDVADRESVTRQAFSTDVKAALNRRESAIREGRTVRRA